MGIWAEKYRPKYLNQIEYNHDIAILIKSLSNNMPHLLFHGNNGSGKKTFVKALLREIYGDKVDKTQLQKYTYKDDKSINIVVSPYHIEINPSEIGSGNTDHHIVQEVIKGIVSRQYVVPCNFRTMVIDSADELTENAQYALRSIMEGKRSRGFRLILLAKNLDKIKLSIKSRCQIIGIPAPTVSAIEKVLTNISTLENMDISSKKITKIANNCNRNVMHAVLVLQKAMSNNGKVIYRTAWQKVLDDIGLLMLKKPSVSTFKEIRKLISDLLANSVSIGEIFGHITHVLIDNTDIKLHDKFLQQASYFEYLSNVSPHPIIAIEAYIIKCMKIYQDWLKYMLNV